MLEKDNQPNKMNLEIHHLLKSREEAIQSKENLKAINSLLKNLPLETCRRECDSITEEWGWRAPDNKIFRISGHFIINTNQSQYDCCVYPPIRSAEIIKEEHQEEYQEFLKISKGDENTALKLLMEELWFDFEEFDDDVPPKFFDGKWLDTNQENGEFSLNVKEDIQAWYENDAYFQRIKDLAPESKTITECAFTPPISEVYWTQSYAEAILNKCQIDLIDYQEKEKKLFVAKPSDREHLCRINEKKHPTQDIWFVSTRKRQNEQGKRSLEDFDKNNKDFYFSSNPPWRKADLLIAHQREKHVVLPEEDKNQKNRKNLNQKKYDDDYDDNDF